MNIVIQKSGHQDLHITSDTSHLSIQVDKHINASFMLTYSGVKGKLHIQIALESGSSLVMMLKNEAQEELICDLHANVMKDAILRFAYCDLDDANLEMNGSIKLLESGAYADVRSACIVKQPKHFHVEIEHMAAHTSGYMQHYAVVKEHGNYEMQAIGKIVKGAYDSASHQTTRVLTMSKNHNSSVVPLLLIDENDVKASHATTLGQPDENQLYYLQTRGLSREQALGLLSIGYILPITEIFDDEKQNAALKNEIEMKVGLHV